MANPATDSSSIEGPRAQPRPGVTHIERDQFVSAEVPPEDPERARKGDLGFLGMPAPRPLTGPGPFRDLKQGR
jgi:hypothetical protein